MKWINIIVIGVLLLGCYPDKRKAVDLSEIRFSTTDASELYFKNVRKSAYELEENKDAGLDIYRSSDFSEDSIWIEPVIVVNWRTDQAFILLEMNPDTLENPLSFKSGRTNNLLTFDKSNHRNHAEFCVEVYNSLLIGDSLWYTQMNERTLFLDQANHREAYRKVVFDWLRLVEIR